MARERRVLGRAGGAEGALSGTDHFRQGRRGKHDCRGTPIADGLLPAGSGFRGNLRDGHFRPRGTRAGMEPDVEALPRGGFRCRLCHVTAANRERGAGLVGGGQGSPRGGSEVTTWVRAGLKRWPDL